MNGLVEAVSYGVTDEFNRIHNVAFADPVRADENVDIAEIQFDILYASIMTNGEFGNQSV